MVAAGEVAEVAEMDEAVGAFFWLVAFGLG